MADVRKVFDSPVSGREAARKLLCLRQDSRSEADYTVDFRMLAPESAWNPESLFDTFLHGLSEGIKAELAAWELARDLDSPIALTIRINGRLRERRRVRLSVVSHTRSYTVSPLPPKNPGSSRHLHSRENSISPEPPRGLAARLLLRPCNWAELDFLLVNI